jgi:hypothetical protein
MHYSRGIYVLKTRSESEDVNTSVWGKVGSALAVNFLILSPYFLPVDPYSFLQPTTIRDSRHFNGS